MGNNGHSRTALHFLHPPQRVVSLVPSLTESLFDLGLGDAVVGITDFCIHPKGKLEQLPHLGGTKNPRLADIVALHPDLVLANWEENTRGTVETLEAASIPVWVTLPRTVLESLEVLWKLVELFRSPEAQVRLEMLERSLEWTISAAEERPSVRFFCPIWYEEEKTAQSWWMTFNRNTYCHDLLVLLGGENAFAERERRYPLRADLGLELAQDPGERDIRYPRVVLDEIRNARPDLILLPDEPFLFDETHRQMFIDLLPDVPAVENGRVHCIDGSLISWHGTRLAYALQILPPLLFEKD